jgi:proteasome lid subunit RPN8/RPN11
MEDRETSARPVIRIAATALEAVRQHAAAAYPEECCGGLIGHLEPLEIISAQRATNVNALRRQDRFEIAADEQLRMDRAARALGTEVIGFYHSHPDHPARPSEYDAARAWGVYVYLISGVTAAGPTTVTAWRHEGAGFQPLEIEIAD